MTLHFLGGLLSGIWNIGSSIFGGGGGSQSQQVQPQPVIVESKTDYLPIIIIAAVILVAVLLIKK